MCGYVLACVGVFACVRGVWVYPLPPTSIRPSFQSQAQKNNLSVYVYKHSSPSFQNFQLATFIQRLCLLSMSLLPHSNHRFYHSSASSKKLYWFLPTCTNTPSLLAVCEDLYGSGNECAILASQGKCQDNAEWMRINCRESCGLCQKGTDSITLPANKPAKVPTVTASSITREFLIVSKVVKVFDFGF